MSAQTKPRYTLEEYFELERKSEERFEYWGGEIFCMSGVSPEHAQLEVNLISRLNSRLAGKGYRVFPANIRIKVPSAPPYRYADVSALCGEAKFEEIGGIRAVTNRSEEHTSELQSRSDLVCRLLLEKKKIQIEYTHG